MAFAHQPTEDVGADEARPADRKNPHGLSPSKSEQFGDLLEPITPIEYLPFLATIVLCNIPWLEEEMRGCIGQLIALVALSSFGCTDTQLRITTINQGATLAELQYQMVLRNLAA